MLKAILFFGLFFISARNFSNAVNITKLIVPASYLITDAKIPEPLILDCQFDSTPDETGVVLKWLLNEKPIYQWIPNQKPTPLGSMKLHLDPAFSISTDKYDRYRAISIIKPQWNMTGTYMCSVESFQSISRKTAELKVISPETDFNLETAEEEDDLVVTCSVQDIYPDPHLAISINGASLGTELKAETDKNGFDVRAIARKSKDEIESPAKLTCVLTIPGTDYEKTKSTMYYKEVDVLPAVNVPVEELTNPSSKLEASEQTEYSIGLRYRPWSFVIAICLCITTTFQS